MDWGLRISEVLGLTWDNIDFIENTITINKITVRDNNTVILKALKQKVPKEQYQHLKK